MRSKQRQGWFRLALGLVSVAGLFGAHYSAWSQVLPGQMPGNLDVSASGAATFTVPIAVPPGVAGLEPQVSLSYNSHSGTGLAGQGWSLDAGSAITRCPQTLATDGATAPLQMGISDRFCLDGQRLILVAGTYGSGGSEYRTEFDQFSRITAVGAAGGNAANGPERFQVITRDGLTLHYGSTADSRIEAQGKPTAVAAWALARKVDPAGNQVTFGYYENTANGEWRLANMGYSNRSLHIHYQTRPDIQRGYSAGSLETMSARIQRIETRIGAQTVHNTHLTYSGDALFSRLLKIQTCDVANRCLQPLDVSWGWTGAETFTSRTTAGPAAAPPNSLVADFNGDGKADMARHISGGTWQICYTNAAGNGFQCANQAIPALAVHPSVVDVGDFNGDGLSDLATFTGSGRTWHVCLSTGTGFSCAAHTLHRGNQHTNYNGDFNGDGRTDFASRVSGGTWDICLSNSTGNTSSFTCHERVIHGAGVSAVGDFNGDGLSDIAAYTGVGKTWAVCFAGPSLQFACQHITLHGGNQNTNFTGDFNGDGLTDMAAHVGGANWEICYATGASAPSSTGPYFVCQVHAGHGGGHANNAVGDFNGDGKTDIAGYTGSSGTWHVCSSTGSGFNCAMRTGGHGGGATNNAIGDFNGDGVDDMAGFTGSGSNWHIAYSNGRNPGLVSQFQRGQLRQGLWYTSMAGEHAADVYAKDAALTYPLVSLQKPQWLVRTSIQSTGLATGVTNLETGYQYGGMRAEHASAAGRGRGNLGFRWMTATEVATGISSYTGFAQTWPYVGQVAQQETRLAGRGNAGVLKRTNTTFGCYQTRGATATTGCPSNATGLIYHVFPTRIEEASWDLNGAIMPVTVTTQAQVGTPDEAATVRQFGNVTRVQEDVLRNGVLQHRKVTTNEFHPSVVGGSSWRLGKLKKSTVTSSSFITPATAGMSYAPNSGATPYGPALTPEEFAAIAVPIQMLLLEDD